MKFDRWWISMGVLGVLAGALLYAGRQQNDTGAGTPDRALSCQALDGDNATRLDACLAQLPSPTLSSAAMDTLEDAADDGKKVLVIGGAVSGVTTVGIADIAGLRELLVTSNEAEVAKVLRDADVRGIVIGRDLIHAIDRDATVMSRLAQHDFLEWFQLRHVTDDALIYTVRNSAMRVSETTGEMLLAGLRARLEGRPPPRQTWTPDNVRLIGSMRLQGETLVMRHAIGDNLEAVLDDLATKMIRRWEREVEILGFGPIDQKLDEARLEIHVVMERAQVEPRSKYAVADLWELGVDGMMLRHTGKEDDDKFTYMPGSEAMTRSFNEAEEFMQHAVDEFGWRDPRVWEAKGTELFIFRDEHFIEKQLGGKTGVVELFRGMPLEPMSALTDENLRQMLIDGADWWVRNQRKDGSFNYKYWPDQNRLSGDYNEVRHILGPRDLVDAWRYRADPRYLDASRKAMDWLIQFEINDTDPPDPNGLPHPPPGTALFRYPSYELAPAAGKAPNQKLGTTAVALLGWVEWAKATGSKAEDERIRRMAKYVLARQNKNGKFEPYDVPPTHSYYGQVNDIVPGEAALALGMVAEYFGENAWLEFFPRFLDWYEPWFRERAQRRNPSGRWPMAIYDNATRLELVQFGPWAVMASKQYYKLTGDERAAAFGLEVADWMIDSYQWSEARAPFPDYVGGYYKIPEELPAMQTFCYSEGTAAAYNIAIKYAPDRKARYDLSTREALRFLRVMQYDEVDSYFAPRPELIHGGIKYALNENKIRIDYLGHGLSTVTQYLDARQIDPDVTTKLTQLEVGADGQAPMVADTLSATPGGEGGDRGDEGGD